MVDIGPASLVWRKSTYCTPNDCVEVAVHPSGDILLRDSKRPDGGVLRFTPERWQTFVDTVRQGMQEAGGQSPAGPE